MFKKILFLDLETSGLDPIKNGIIQIAGIIDIDGKEVERFQLFNNCSNKVIEDSALKVNGYSREQIRTFPAPGKTYKSVIDILAKYVDRYDKADKFIIAGQFVNFDVNFLQQFFKENNDNYLFSWFESRSYLDTKYIYNFLTHCDKMPQLENSKNETISKYFNQKLDGIHNAMKDIELTRNNFYSMCNLIKSQIV